MVIEKKLYIKPILTVYPFVDKVMYAEVSAPLVLDDFENEDTDPALNNDNAGW